MATFGVSNLIIIHTPDALLVADRAKAQDVTSIVARLKQSNRKEHELHVRCTGLGGSSKRSASARAFR